MFLCRLNRHKFTERDEHGRTTCNRCGRRQPIVYATIPDPALEGRQLSRPKTKGRRA